MSRFTAHADMTAAELFDCVKDARAILELCHQAAWAIQNTDNETESNGIADAVQQASRLAFEMLGPVYDALVVHEGSEQ